MNELKQRIDCLRNFTTEERWERINTILSRRTRYFTTVLEDVFDPHNISAVIRSGECLGLQDLHLILNTVDFRPSRRVVRGASKWIDLHRYSSEEGQNTRSCLESLKERGYRIAATTLRADKATVPVDELPLDKPIAVCFGSENEGLSDSAHECADVYVQIPMHGFTQSFNISVSAAICMYELTKRIRTSESIDWQLPENEITRLQYKWLTLSVEHWGKILERSGF